MLNDLFDLVWSKNIQVWGCFFFHGFCACLWRLMALIPPCVCSSAPAAEDFFHFSDSVRQARKPMADHQLGPESHLDSIENQAKLKSRVYSSWFIFLVFSLAHWMVFFRQFQTQTALPFNSMGSGTTYASNFHRLVRLVVNTTRPWRRQWKVLRRIQSGASSMAWASLVFWFSTAS